MIKFLKDNWEPATLAAGTLGIFSILFMSAGPSPNYSFEDMIQSSIQIGKYCSGTVVEDQDLSDGKQFTVVSAKHCLDEYKKEGIGTVLEINIPNAIGNRLSDDKTIKMIVKDVSLESDLVYLQGMKPDEDYGIKPINIHSGLPKIGDQVWSVSFPLGETKTITSGYLGYILHNDWTKDISKSNDWQKTTASIAPGSSGSGLYIKTDEGYKLMGVLTWMDQRADYVSYYTPLDEVQTFLGKQKNGGA